MIESGNIGAESRREGATLGAVFGCDPQEQNWWREEAPPQSEARTADRSAGGCGWGGSCGDRARGLGGADFLAAQGDCPWRWLGSA